jgi:hypothetical protein
MWFLFTLAVVLLLFAFPRQMSVILAIGALIGTVAGGFYLWEKRKLTAQESAVEITVVYDPEQCGPAAPLLVTIDNRSGTAVARAEWVFSARRPGYRGELTGGWLKAYASDNEIAPGQQQTVCCPAPKPGQHAVQRTSDDPAMLDLGIRSRQISFAE